MSKLNLDISGKVNYRFLSGSSSLSKILTFDWLILVFQNSGKFVSQNSKKIIGQYLEGCGVFGDGQTSAILVTLRKTKQQ